MDRAPSLRRAHARPEPPRTDPVAPWRGVDPEGHLATGWESYRPLSDGLVRRFIFAYASTFTSPVALMGGHVVHREPYVIWDRGVPAGLYNGAMLLQPLPHTGWREIIDGVEADLVRGGRGEVTLFSPWPTPDLAERGWRLGGHPPLLLRPAGGPEPPAPDGLEVREVGDARTLADWERVAVEGYPLHELQPYVPGSFVDERILADPRLHAWVASTEEGPIAIGTAYTVHGLHVPTLGVTLPDRRGRGTWQYLMQRRLSTFRSMPAMALFSDHSRPPAEGLGFLPLSRWTVWLRGRPKPSSEPRSVGNHVRRTKVPGERPYFPP